MLNLYIIILIHLLEHINGYYTIKFSRNFPIEKESTNLTLFEFIKNRVNNIYKTEILIGEPSQKIIGFLNSDSHGFFLSNENCPERVFFEIEKSKTINIIKNNNTKIRFSDTLSFNTNSYSRNNGITIHNYTLCIDKLINEPLCFHIGTQLSRVGEINLLTELHNNKFITNYYYYYKISSGDDIYLFFNVSIYDNKDMNYKIIKPLSSYNYKTYQIEQTWGMEFENVFLNNETLYYSRERSVVQFDINLNCIIGTFYFKESFNKFLRENKIYVRPLNYKNEYYVYFFEKNMEGIYILKNINIKFYHEETNYYFTFDYKDLFLEKINGYYFLIVFEFDNKYKWKFGIPFFKKYKFIFNLDSKLMTFFENTNIDNNINNIKDQKNEENKNFTFKVIWIIILGFIFIVILVLIIGILIGKKFFGIRKTKVNELLELYDYTSNKK
jgi:hypothetical protein